MVGTTVAPWQLFFQQSSVVDKRITARWLGYERADTAIGTLLFAVGAVAVLAATAALVLLPAAILGAALGARLCPEGPPSPPRRSRTGPPAWTMPPIETLPPPPASRARVLGLVALRAYLLLAAVVVIVKVVQLT